MISNRLIIQLHSLFGENPEWPWLILALRQDKLIWDHLKEPSVYQKTFSSLSGKHELWVPTNLALVSLSENPVLLTDDQPVLQPNDQQITARASKLWQAYQNDPDQVPIELNNACLLAVNIYDIYQAGKNWSGIFEETSLNNPLFRTAIACLIRFFPNPSELFDFLGQLLDPERFTSLVVGALLSNATSKEYLFKTLYEILPNLEVDTQVTIIRAIKHERPFIALNTLKHLLEQLQLPTRMGTFLQIQDFNLYNIEAQAEYYAFLNDDHSALTALNKFLALSRRLQAKIAANIAFHIEKEQEESNQANQILDAPLIDSKVAHAAKLNSIIDALTLATQLDPDEPEYLANLVQELNERNKLEEAWELVLAWKNNNAPCPSMLYSEALLKWSAGDEHSAYQLASQALKALSQTNNFSPNATLQFKLALLLNKLQAFPEALTAAEITLAMCPSDSRLYELLAELCLRQAKYQVGLEYAYLAIAIDPSNEKAYEILVSLLETVGDWDSALVMHKNMLPKSSSQKYTNTLAQAFCALQAHNPKKTISLCQEISNNDNQASLTEENHSVIYWLIGSAHLSQGHEENGLHNIHDAIHISPSLVPAWITLSEQYIHQNHKEKAEEILRAASQANPGSPIVHYNLGKVLLSRNALTEALPYLQSALRQSESLHPTLPLISLPWEPNYTQNRILENEIRLSLGKTLFQLGYQAEAAKVFEKVDIRDPEISTNNPDMAFAYARNLAALGKNQKAIPLLEFVIKQMPDNILAYFIYAKIMLQSTPDIKTKVQEALTNLLHFIKHAEDIQETEQTNIYSPSPDNLVEAKLLTGESYLLLDQSDKAITYFSQLLSSNAENQNIPKLRTLIGLGKAALGLRKLDMAVATFQEAAQLDHNNLEVHRYLSDAYLESGLVDNAYQSAYTARQLDPSNIDNLCWFADQCLKIHQTPDSAHLQAQKKATQALERAIQVDPSRIDLLILCSQIYLEAGNHSTAIVSLGKIASNTKASPEDLLFAATNLHSLGESEQAISIYTQAIDLLTQSSIDNVDPLNEEFATKLYVELTQTLKETQNPTRALQIIEHAIANLPESADLYLEHANLLLDEGNIPESKTALGKALAVNPDNPEIHFQLAKLHYDMGEIIYAQENIRHAIDHIDLCRDPEDSSKMYVLAAKINYVLLDLEGAIEYLEGINHIDECMEAQILHTEIVLLTNDERIIHFPARSQYPSSLYPRLLALYVRIIAQQDGINKAIGSEYLTQLATRLDDTHVITYQDLFGLISIGLMFIEIGHWSMGYQVLRTARSRFPNTPLSHYCLAHAALQCARAIRICDALEIIAHAPDENIRNQLVPNNINSIFQDIQNQLTAEYHLLEDQFNLLRARADAILTSSPQNLWEIITNSDEYQATAEEIAELIFAIEISKFYTQSVQQSPITSEHPLILLLKAIALIEIEPSQALDALQIAIKNKSSFEHHWATTTPIIQAALAFASSRCGNYQEAFEAIQSALSFWNDEIKWHIFAAEIAQKLDEPDLMGAISHFELAITLDPDQVDHYIAYGKFLLGSDQPDQAVEILERACMIDSKRRDTWLLLAHAHLGSGELDQAAYSASRALDQTSEQNSDALIDALRLQGEIALRKSDANAALSRAQTILHLKPDDPGALSLLARSLRNLNQIDKALVAIDMAIPLTQDPLPLLLERVRLIHESQGYEKAIIALQKLIDANPDEIILVAQLSYLLAEAGDYEAAVQMGLQALRTHSGKLDRIEQSKLHHVIGKALREEGHLDKALYHLDEAIQTNPENLDAYIELGKTHQGMREYSQALKIFQEAINVAPTDSRPYYLSGIVLKEMKNYSEAEKNLRKAAEYAPEDVNIHRTLGAIVVLNLIHNRQPEPTEYKI